MKGYKIDFAKNTVTMNYKFAAAAATRGTPEYKEIKKIRADFPDLAVVTFPGRRPSKTVGPNKRLTYTRMERHMSGYPNADELLAVFEKVKTLSATAHSPYKYVSDWFKMQFPNYRTPQIPIIETVRAVAPPNIEDYQKDKAA